MDKELKEYLDSLKDEKMPINRETTEGIKEIEQFVSIVCKNEKNYIDFVRYIHFTERDSILFSNAKYRHVGALAIHNELYKKYYTIITNTDSELHKKVNEDIK